MSMRAVINLEVQGGSAQSLRAVRSALNESGLWDVRADGAGELVALPETSLFGEFDTHDPAELRDRLHRLVTKVLADQGLQGRVMVVVGADLTWLVGDEAFGLIKP